VLPDRQRGNRVVTEFDDHSTAAETTSLTLSERRRPGRMATVSPALTPILRGTAVSAPSPASDERREDDLAPGIGIAVSVLISAPMCALALWITWRIVRYW
jgi:hypothetical protein